MARYNGPKARINRRLGIYFTFSEPGFMDPLFTNPIGWALIAVVIFLEVIAYFVIKKVIQVDV